MAISRAHKVFELVGRVTAAWNDVELLWYLIYTCLLFEAPRSKADIIFRQFKTGSAQRQFAMALANVAFEHKHHQKYRAAMGRLCARTDDLSGLRNALVHGDYQQVVEQDGTQTIRIAPGGDMSKRNKLGGRPLEAQLAELLPKIAALVSDLDRLRNILASRFLPPDKRVPRLPKELRGSPR